MQVHLFGGISWPSCASYAVRKIAYDNENKFGSEAGNTLRNYFYVDDMLMSKESAESAIKVILAVRAMCQAGGFYSTIFVSNSGQVLESIPINDRAKDVRSLDFSQETLPVDRILEVQ
jgi:hypothetical protein